MNLAILEGDFFILVATFIDRETGAEVLPLAVDYQIFCKTSRKLVRDWTSVPADTSVRIDVLSEDNAIQNDRKDRETKQLVLRATITSEKQKLAKFEWIVENLRGFD